MTITLPAGVAAALGRATLVVPLPWEAAAPFDPLPVGSEAPKVPSPNGLTPGSGELSSATNPYKPYVNPAGHTFPSVAAPSRMGVPPSHLIGMAMASMHARPMGGTVSVTPTVGPLPLPTGIFGGGAPTPSGPSGTATALPISGLTMLPTRGTSQGTVGLPKLAVLNGSTLPAVARGTVPRWA